MEEVLPVAQVTNSPPLMEPESSLLCLQDLILMKLLFMQ